MIGKALVFLKDKLNEDLSSNQEIVVFPDGVKLEPLTFRLGAITLLLVNIEQEPAPQNAGFKDLADQCGEWAKSVRSLRFELQALQ